MKGRPGEATLLTRYIFDNLMYAKGTGPANGFALITEARRVGPVQEQLPDPDIPRFNPGQRDIVLAVADWPVAGVYGVNVCLPTFFVGGDSASQVPVVQAGPGRPLVAFHDRYLVIASRPWEPEAATSKRPQRTAYRGGPAIPEVPPDLSPWTWASRDTTDQFEEQQARSKAAAAGTPWFEHVHTEIIYRQRDPGTRVTEAEFLDQIRAIVREQAAADSAAARLPAGQIRNATPVSPGPPAQEATPPQPPVRVHPGQEGK